MQSQSATQHQLVLQVRALLVAPQEVQQVEPLLVQKLKKVSALPQVVAQQPLVVLAVLMEQHRRSRLVHLERLHLAHLVEQPQVVDDSRTRHLSTVLQRQV